METIQSQPDDKVVFVPSDEIRNISYVLNKLEQAQKEFRKAAEMMKPLKEELGCFVPRNDGN